MKIECIVRFQYWQQAVGFFGTVTVVSRHSADMVEKIEIKAKELAETIWKNSSQESGVVYVYGVRGQNILTLKTPDVLEPQTS
jgi:hypothetical protein